MTSSSSAGPIQISEFLEPCSGVSGKGQPKTQLVFLFYLDLPCYWLKSSVSIKTAYSNICKTVQTRLRDMQDSWLSEKADEIQSFADRKDMKKFFDALNTVYGPQNTQTTLLFSAQGFR